MIPVWFNCGRGIWDQGMIESLISGQLWPVPATYEVAPGLCPGGVVVIHGEYAQSNPVPPIPPNSVVLLTGNELRGWKPREHCPGDSKVWAQHIPIGDLSVNRRLIPGWPPGTREGLTGIARGPLDQRRLWGFAGQINNISRGHFMDSIKGRTDGTAHASAGFAQGMEHGAYLRFLADCAIAPSPGGAVNPEGFRLYESLEAGCLPVAQRSYPGWPEPQSDWWIWAFDQSGKTPFPTVNSWSELPAILDRYAKDTIALQRDANRAGAWWLAHKRRMAFDLFDDCHALSGVRPEAKGLSETVTVLMSSSVIPGHPSIDLIAETIRRVRSYPALEACEILIMLDGVPAEDAARARDYEEYRRRLIDACNFDPAFRGCLPIVFEEHAHQTEMTRHALAYVRTPLVFFVEHDTYPMGDIDFGGIATVLLEDDSPYKMIRLHICHKVLDEQARMYINPTAPIEVSGVPLIRTVEWSQRPHLARTAWYRTIIESVQPGKKIWIEHAMHSDAMYANWERFGMAIYAPEGENMTRSGHSDGRRWRVDAA